MEIREQQNRFLQPIHDSDRQGERKSRVFLKAKVIQASSQLNPERGKIFIFPGQQPENPNFGQRNFAQQFRFRKQTDFTLDLRSSSQSYFPGNPPISHNSIFYPPDIRFGGGSQQLHHSTMSLQKSPLSLNFWLKMIFMQNALILISLNVQTHHRQPDCVTSL